MVNKTTAQKAVVAALSGMMALAPVMPAFAARTAGTKDTGDSWDNIERLAGDDRYGTMTEILDELYGTESDGEITYSILNTAILVSGEMYPDALAASTLSGAGYTIETAKWGRDSDGVFPTPIIITKGNALSDEAADALDNLNILNVIILGGENTISKDVEDKLVSEGYNVERIAGADRAATSLEAAKYVERVKGSVSRIFVVSGDNYADAISAGPIVIGGNSIYNESDGYVTRNINSATDVLLFAKNGVLTDDQVDFIKVNAGKYGVDGSAFVFVIGGEASVSSTAFAQAGEAVAKYGLRVQRISGADRYATSAAVASAFNTGNRRVEGDFRQFGSPYDFLNTFVVATGENYPDALVGAPFAAYNHAPIVLVNDSGSGMKFLKNALAKDATGWVISGENMISDDTIDDIQDYCE